MCLDKFILQNRGIAMEYNVEEIQQASKQSYIDDVVDEMELELI